MSPLKDAGFTELSVEHSVGGLMMDDGFPLPFGLVWGAGAFGFVLLCSLPAPEWPGAQGPRDRRWQEAFKGRVREEEQRRRQTRRGSLPPHPRGSTPGNFILNLGKRKRKTVFSLRTLYQDQANNNSVILGLQAGFRPGGVFPLLSAYQPDFTKGISSLLGVDNIYGFLLERFHLEEVSGKS